MCGIVGQIQLHRRKPNVVAMRKMRNAMKHRGPSGAGEYVHKQVAIGMRRLSIIDVSGGDQPLYNEDKSIVIIGNGEIYNYKELQTYLVRHGHKLRTGSDIETIAHLYEEYGEKCFTKLRGMFAVCLYDRKKQIVLIGRDRLGEKPLYWSTVHDSIVFSSEMKALIEFPDIKLQVRPEGIQSYFAYYYIPEPFTMFEDVFKLGAGSYMRVDLQTGAVSQQKYWNTDDVKTSQRNDPTSNIQKTLKEIGTITKRSDVPVGISLSGGLDSATVLALASIHKDSSLKAFSVGYEHRPATDERALAKELAASFGVEYFEKEISIKDVVKDFPKTVFFSDDPIADIAAYGIYSVAQLARKHGVPVLLSGVGGDELFWGYQWMRDAGAEFVRSKKVSFYDRSAGFGISLLFLKCISGKALDVHLKKQNIEQWKPTKKISSNIHFGRFGIEAIRDYWLKGDCLTLGDRMSMAASVELRVPLVDYKLHELVLKNMHTVTAFTKESKWYLKQAVNHLLPSSLFQRKKRGFTPPVKEWIVALIASYGDLLSDGYLVRTGLVHRRAVRIIQKCWRMLPFFWYQLYALLVLELWCRMYIEKQSVLSLSRSYKG